MTEQFDRYIAQAIDWARAHIGSVEYSFRCLAFVEDAYEKGNHIEMFGGSTAHESAETYEAHANLGLPPPLGAFVFYDCVGTLFEVHKNWGHVGLCLGSGQVIHAWDQVRQDHYLSVEGLPPSPGWLSPRYTGWAPVERILTGFRVKE